MSKHTLGPWEVTDDGYIIESEKCQVAEVYFYSYEEGERIDIPYRANARLIAAAPEMYELMPKLISLLGNWAYILDQIGNYDTSESWDLADKWIEIRLKIEGDE